MINCNMWWFTAGQNRNWLRNSGQFSIPGDLVIFLGQAVKIWDSPGKIGTDGHLSVKAVGWTKLGECAKDCGWRVFVILCNARVSDGMPLVSSQSHLLTYVRRSCLPFLRASAMFFHFLTNVTPPAILTSGMLLSSQLCHTWHYHVHPTGWLGGVTVRASDFKRSWVQFPVGSLWS